MMATQLSEAARRRRPRGATRHPMVAIAMVLPFAILLLAFCGGWDLLAAQTKAVADLLKH